MKHLGIDYGTKRVGIAVSDALGSIAFPREIIPSDNKLPETISSLVEEEHIGKIVVGHSKAYDGSDNALQKDIERFVSKLEEKLPDVPVVLHDERGSSIAAKAHLYSKGNIANERWSGKDNAKKKEQVDARAAAVILQRYLDMNIL